MWITCTNREHLLNNTYDVTVKICLNPSPELETNTLRLCGQYHIYFVCKKNII